MNCLDVPLVSVRAPIRPDIGTAITAPRADHAGTERPDRRVVRHVISAQGGAVMGIALACAGGGSWSNCRKRGA
jgi:hypothetical protein